MILGIGTDLVEIDRIEKILKRHGNRFVMRVFAEHERAFAATDPQAPAHYAKRFAAKEAAAKALGSGINHSVYLRDIVVEKTASGAPRLILLGGAARRLGALSHGAETHVHVSLSDEAAHALAFVVIEVRDVISSTPDHGLYP